MREAQGDEGNDKRQAEPQTTASRDWVLVALVSAVPLAVASLQLLGPLRDNDFFWHLKTGDWILFTRRLPSQDPFCYTSPSAPGDWQRFILTSYWLAQVLYSISFKLAGFKAILVLRGLLAALLWGLMLLRAPVRGALAVSVTGLCSVALLAVFPFERPQAFSFVYFAALVWLLDAVRKTPETRLAERLGLAAVPGLMFFWANTHGGHVVGQAALVLFLVTEAARYLKLADRSASAGRPRLIAGTVAMGLVASCLNPNGWRATAHLSTLAEYNSSANVEYASPYFFMTRFGAWPLLVFFALLCATVLALLKDWRRAEAFEVLLLVGTGLVSLRHLRYVPFFMVLAAPFVIRSLRGEGNPRRWLRAVVVSAALLASVTLPDGLLENVRGFRAGLVLDPGTFPIAAAEVLAKTPFRGHLYNHFDWGGYLIWRLGPSQRVFVDGRCLDPAACMASVGINMAANVPDGRRLWRQVFDSFQVGAVITAWRWPTGEPLPLAAELNADPAWRKAYSDPTAVIFVRNW